MFSWTNTEIDAILKSVEQEGEWSNELDFELHIENEKIKIFQPNFLIDGTSTSAAADEIKQKFETKPQLSCITEQPSTTKVAEELMQKLEIEPILSCSTDEPSTSKAAEELKPKLEIEPKLRCITNGTSTSKAAGEIKQKFEFEPQFSGFSHGQFTFPVSRNMKQEFDYSQFVESVGAIRNDSNKFQNIIWEKKHLQLHAKDIAFRGQQEMPENVKNLTTPYDCFKYFVTDDFLQLLADQTNLIKNPKKYLFATDAVELQKFIGVLMFMSLHKYPLVAFWLLQIFEPIRRTMSFTRFQDIWENLGFDDSAAETDKITEKRIKIRPIISYINERFASVPMPQCLCVDKVAMPDRQCMPEKSVFVLCDSTGFCYSIEVYSGGGDSAIVENAPDLGSTSNVIVFLAQHIPDNRNHVLCFNNFFSSMGLMVFLKCRGILSAAMVCSNRIPKSKLLTDDMIAEMNVHRGYAEEYVGSAYGVDITSVLWRAIRNYRLLSTYAGVKDFLPNSCNQQPCTPVTKEDEKIEWPQVAKEYKQHMSGLERLHDLLHNNHIKIESKKNAIILDLLDVATVNAYLLYHRLHKNESANMPQSKFREMLAKSLCSAGLS